jgi:hypothetical protein
MHTIRNRQRIAATAIAATAVCSLGVVWQSQADTPTEPHAAPPPKASGEAPGKDAKSISGQAPGAVVARPEIKRSAGDIPFDPPRVYPDNSFALEQPEKLQRKLAGNPGRDLMFREEDRKIFQAMHPVYRVRPKIVEVEKSAKSQQRVISVNRTIIDRRNALNDGFTKVVVPEPATDASPSTPEPQGFVKDK